MKLFTQAVQAVPKAFIAGLKTGALISLLALSFIAMVQGPPIKALVGGIVAGTILYRNVTIRKRV